jgi:TatA/E family protein of Tat protein translocase
MLNLGGPEMVWIFLLILLLFGAQKLPKLARGIGESLGEFKKARDEFERELRYAEYETEQKERAEKAAKAKPVEPDPAATTLAPKPAAATLPASAHSPEPAATPAYAHTGED